MLWTVEAINERLDKTAQAEREIEAVIAKNPEIAGWEATREAIEACDNFRRLARLLLEQLGEPREIPNN